MSSKDAEKLRKQAKAQLLAKYGRLMALYLTGKNGNFAGIPKEAKDLADSILSANDERSLRALYNVTKQLKTNSKKQMKDVPEMMGLPPPQRPVGDDYTSVVQSIPSITLSHHVLSQHKVDLYRKVKDDQGVVSFKKISSKQEKDDDTLEIKYGGTLGFRRTTEQIEEKDIKSKISLKKVDVPTWTKYFEDNKARLLESEKKWLKQRKGTLTGEEKRKCEQKLKAIDEILKQLKKDAKADAERKEKEAADKKKEEAKKSFQNALRGKIPLGECKFEGVVLGQLPDQDAVKVAIIETIDAIVSDESNPPFFINLDDSSLDQIKDVRDLQDKSLDYMLKNVYVIESEWGSATLDFKSKYQSEIDRKKAKPAAEALKVKTIKELEAKQEAEKKRREEAAALAAMKKRKEEAAKIKKLREDDLKKAAKAAELASKAEISPKPSAPPSDQMKQETKDDEPEDSGLSDPNSLYSRILRQQDEERRRMYADGGPGGEVPPSDCFDMVTVPNKGEHMARDQLELKQNSLTDVFGYTAEQNNIFKLLFLYALKHQYIKLNGVPLSQICWQDDKLKYISARTKGDLMELTRKDLKNVKLNMKKFRVVSDDFLERDELPILDDKQKSDFAAKTFPDKFNYVKVSDQGLKAKLSIDTKKYVTLEEAGKDIKWLFETAKDKGTKMNVYAFSRQKSQKQKVVGFYYPVVLIARKKQDKDTIDQKKFKFYYKNEKNENTKLIREEGYVWGTVDFSIYVQRSIVNPSTISTFAKPKRKKGKRRFTAPPAPRFVLEFEEGAAFMDTKVFYEVIVPLLEVENTALICISTPQDSMNFYSEMFTLKTPDGKPLFNTLEVSLICDACKKSENPEQCPHKSDEIPPWKSLQKLDMVKAIYGTNTELLKRESMGIITQDMASVFKTKYVDALMEKQRYKLIKEPRFVFIGSDPNGGGSSDMSIFSCVMEYNSICIVGLETHQAKDHNGINALLCAHIEKLRSHKELADAWFIFLPEANLGHEASHMAHMIRNYRKIWTISERGRTGIITTNTRKELYAIEATKYVQQESLHFWEKMVVSNPFSADSSKEEARVLEEFKKQLYSFKRIIVHPQRGFVSKQRSFKVKSI